MKVSGVMKVRKLSTNRVKMQLLNTCIFTLRHKMIEKEGEETAKLTTLLMYFKTCQPKTCEKKNNKCEANMLTFGLCWRKSLLPAWE